MRFASPSGIAFRSSSSTAEWRRRQSPAATFSFRDCGGIGLQPPLAIERAAGLPSHELSMSDQLVYRLTDLVRVINLSKSTIYELIRRKDFPSPVKFTARSVGWRAPG
jgi:predicted DNA-binding transcriptional regulator AlpA